MVKEVFKIIIELLVLILFIVFSISLLIARKKIIFKDFYLIALYFIICCLPSLYNGDIKKIFIYILVLCLVFPFFKESYIIFTLNISGVLRDIENYFIENNINYNIIKRNRFYSILESHNHEQKITLKFLCFFSNIEFNNYNSIEVSKILNKIHEN